MKNLLDEPPSPRIVALKMVASEARTELVVDKTGVGVAVTDLLKERRLNYIAVTITGLGQKVERTGMQEYSVPKQDLVSALEVPFHKETLKVAEGLKLWAKSYAKELLNFRRKQNTRTAHIITSTGGSRTTTTWCSPRRWPAGRRPTSGPVVLS